MRKTDWPITGGKRAYTSLGFYTEDFDILTRRTSCEIQEWAKTQIKSSLPDIRKENRPVRKIKKKPCPKRTSCSPFASGLLVYAGGKDGTVEHWKKVARNSEMLMHLEHKQHQSDLVKDSDSIHRLRCRISALDASIHGKDALIESQGKKIKVLKDQLEYAHKTFDKELDYLQAQANYLQRKLLLTNEDSKKQINFLKDDLESSNLRLELLHNQMREVYGSTEEPLENSHLFGYFEEPGKIWGKEFQDVISSGVFEKFWFEKMKINNQGGVQDNSLRTEELVKKIIASILCLRVTNTQLGSKVKFQEEMVGALNKELQSLKKQVLEASHSRASVVSTMKSLEAVTEKLNAIDALLSQSPISGKLIAGRSADSSQSKPHMTLERIESAFKILLSEMDVAKQKILVLNEERDVASVLMLKIKAAVSDPKENVKLDRADKTISNTDMEEVLTVVTDQKRILEETKQKLQSLQKEKASKETIISEKESTLKNLEASIQDLRSTNQSLVNTFDGIQQFLNIENMQPLTTGKASKGNQYSWDVQQIMKGLEKLKGEKDSLIRSNLKLEKEKEQVEIELQRLQTLVGNLGTSFNDENTPECVNSKGSGKSEDVVSNLGKQIKTLKGEKTRLEQMLEEANIHCISLHQNMEKLKNVFADVLNESKDSYTGNIQNVKLGLIKLNMMSEEMQHLVSKAEAIREHRSRTVSKLEELEHQKNDMERKKTSENEDLRKQREAILNKLQTIENEKKEVENRKISETERISQLLKQRDELERDKFTIVASLNKQRDDLLNKLKVMETEKADALSKLKTLENEKSKAESVSFKVRDELKKHLASVLCSLYEHYKELKEDAREALIIEGIDKLKDEVISLRNESSKTLPSTLAKLVHLIDIVEENTREAFISAKTGRYENARQAFPKGIEMLDIGAQPEGEMIEKIGFIQDRIVRLHKFVGEELKMLARVIKEAEDFKQAQPGVCEMLKKEIIRLGGYDLDNHDEKARRMAAARRVISCLSGLPSKTVQVDPNANPLKQLATFQVEFLVNTKVHRRLEVDGDLGGVYQGAIHYFKINPQDGDISFANATMPGSQSSNMFVELLFLPANAAEVYETKSGDILGVGVKVKSGNEKDLREVVYNTCVINTDEVMEAVKGQPIDNFSLWPDLVSSWRWERNARGGWALMCIRWRFLLKNIFPELSDPLQVLAITGAKSSLDRSQTIKTIPRR